MGCRDVRRTQALYLLDRQRLSGVLGQFLLLSGKRHWRRRRRGLCHYRAVDDRGWRPSHMSGSLGSRSENAFAGWSHHCPRPYGSRGDLFYIYWHSRSSHGSRTPEHSLRNSGHRAGHRLVYIRDIRDGGVVRDLIVIDVGDGRGIDVGIAGVDAIEVSAAGGICRHVHFPRTQRKPAYIAPTVATSTG
jgi:hypothetical protein